VTLCPTYCLGFFIYRGARSQEDKENIKNNGLGYTIMKKLLEIGGYVNKGYHVFVDDYVMSVQLVRHLHQLNVYITGTVRRNRKLLSQRFKNKFAVGQKMYCRFGPFPTCVFSEKKSQKDPIILSSHATAKKNKYTLENASLNTGANCRRYVCTVLHNVM
jgi:hypothetical protein